MMSETWKSHVVGVSQSNRQTVANMTLGLHIQACMDAWTADVSMGRLCDAYDGASSTKKCSAC